MLTPYKINVYCEEFKPEWVCEMPPGCPPEDVMVPSELPFFRLASQADAYTAEIERLLNLYPHQWFNYSNLWSDDEETNVKNRLLHEFIRAT